MARPKEPGLLALNESKRTRKRQIVTGKAAIGGIPPKLFLSGLGLLLVGGFVYFRVQAAQLEEQRGALLAEQRAVEKALGAELRSLRDEIEGKVQSLAKVAPKDQVGSTRFEELFAQPGVFLRLRLEDAQSPETMRRAAQASLRDGFTACLIRDPKAPFPEQGQACRESSECQPGELCTEFKVCQRPSSPFNMRLVYRAMSVLDDPWVDQVKEASNDLALRAQRLVLESVTRVDVPLAIEVFQRAKYAVVVLDEAPTEDIAAERGPEESLAEFAQRIPHVARVGVWSLPEGEPLAVLRLRADGELRDVGHTKAIGGADSIRTRARQANSCALAVELKGRLMRHTAPAAE